MVRSVLIVAGGSGQRFSSGIPKQFQLVHGKPLLLYAMEAFYYADDRFRIYIALPSDWISYWTGLCDELGVRIPFTITPGGRTRFESVKNAMSFIESAGLIAVHDAARALVSKELIHRCFEEAGQHGNAVPVVPVNDSVREKNDSGSRVIQRDTLVLVQTPQVFRADTLHKAYAQPGLTQYTDDAGLIEVMGERIHLTEGDPINFKITFPHELKLAEALLSR